jgi:hypothetical protein
MTGQSIELLVMSIYATLWALQFPRFGEFHIDCEWVTVVVRSARAWKDDWDTSNPPVNKMIGKVGFEPTSADFGGRCPAVRRLSKIGEPGWNRTTFLGFGDP